MMKSGLLLVAVALLLGGLVGTLVVRDPGYVLIAYADSAIETSLWFSIVVLVTGYFALRLAVWTFSRTAKSGGKVGKWLRRRKGQTAREQTVQGLLQMAQGDWSQARKLLTASASKVESPLINYLSAARAAHEMGDIEGRDTLLREAHQSTPGSRFAVGLTQAELQSAAGQWEQCLATLLRLREQAPRHPLVLKMLIECYERLGDRQAMLELLPDALKAKALGEEELKQRSLTGWRARLSEDEAPEQVWAMIPKELKKQPGLVAAFARAVSLTEGGDRKLALAELKSALQHSWDSELVTLYGAIKGEKPRDQLAAAESWLKQHPDDAALLLALGRISLMNEEWDKAREYLETSLRLEASPAVYSELGRLCSATGDVERGNEYLLLSAAEVPELPLPVRG